MVKLGKRLCKNCKKEFQKDSPLQSVCSPTCAIERSYELNKKKREKDVIENLQAVCRKCHEDYGDKAEFKDKLKETHLNFMQYYGKNRY
jgi:hypothetical protein